VRTDRAQGSGWRLGFASCQQPISALIRVPHSRYQRFSERMDQGLDAAPVIKQHRERSLNPALEQRLTFYKRVLAPVALRTRCEAENIAF